MDIITKRLKTKDIELNILPEVLDYLAKEGYNPQYGARPLNRLIQSKILTPIASFMVSQGVMEGGRISVGMNEKGEPSFEVRKRAVRSKRQTSKKKEKVLA